MGTSDTSYEAPSPVSLDRPAPDLTSQVVNRQTDPPPSMGTPSPRSIVTTDTPSGPSVELSPIKKTFPDKKPTTVEPTANVTSKVAEKISPDSEEPSRLEEAANTLSNEGVGAFVSQLGSYIGNKWAENTGGKESVVIQSGQLMSEEEFYEALTPGISKFKSLSDKKNQTSMPPEFRLPEVQILSKGIKSSSFKNTEHVPIAVNTSTAKFGYRNRGDASNIESKGSMISTYNPFRATSEFIGAKEASGFGSNSDTSSVIALNTKTGQVEGGKFSRFKGNDDYVVSRTLPAKEVSKISIGKDNEYFSGIAQRGIRTHSPQGTHKDLPIGIGKDSSGSSIGGWTGGKMFITTPDGKNGYFVYGSAKQLSDQLENYKKIQGVDHVLWYDMDHKAFSQAYSNTTGVLSGEASIRRDNTNSTGGHFLYLK